MPPERLRRLEALITRASEAGDEEREALLDAAADEDAELAAEARRLIGHERRLGAFLEPPDADLIERLLPRARMRAEAGRRIGPYRLIRPIETGGMGSVYYAVRDDGAFDQEVAVKLLRVERLDDDHIARFERERSLLARVRHPAVARLLDGGAAPDGQPYLVMEYIDGDPIDHWCDQRRLTTRERVRLFLPICDAVREAHRALVLHGDIKPHNILVGDDGAPRLVDFGLSVDLLDAGGDAPLPGLDGGTPGFNSPEQTAGDPPTTASDVYALGRTLDALLAESDADLRAVIARATDHDPRARYASAAELASDLDRWLRRRPVAARGDDPIYRAARFSARHRAALAGVVIACVSLVVAGVVTVRSAALDRAARAAAVEAASDAERTAAFLQTVLAASDPYGDSDALSVQSMLDEAATRIDLELAGHPRVEADVRHSLAMSFAGLWRWRDVAAQLEPALALDQRHHLWSGRDRVAARTLHGRALAHVRDPGAVPFMEETLDLARADDAAPSAAIADALGCLAFACWQSGDPALLERAEQRYREALAMFRALENDSPRDHARIAFSFAALLTELGRNDEAEQRFVEAVEMMRTLPGGPDRYTAECLAMYASLLRRTGRAAEAAALYDEAFAITPASVRDPRTVTFRWERAAATAALGRTEPALRQALDAFLLDLRAGADARPATRDATERLRTAIEAALPQPRGDDLADAFAFVADAYETDGLAEHAVRRAAFLGALLTRAGDAAGARPLLSACLRRAVRLADEAPEVEILTRLNLAEALLELGDLDEAAAIHDRAAQLADARLDADDPLAARVRGVRALIDRGGERY